MSENQELWLFIGTVGIVAALIWFWIEICFEKKHLYWRRPAHMKDMSHGEWKGYRVRWEQLEEMHRPKAPPDKRGWSEGWDRAQGEWERKSNEDSQDESN